MGIQKLFVTLSLVLAVVLTVIRFSPVKPTTANTVEAKQVDARIKAHLPRQYPDHVTYELLFRKVQLLLSKNIPPERLAALLEQDYALKTDHIERFKLIALSHLAQVRDKDARAVAIIERLRARHKGGVLAPGEAAPSVPAELVSMQEERNNILKHARTELSTSMNAEDFKLFDDKVKNRISMPVEPPHSIR